MAVVKTTLLTTLPTINDLKYFAQMVKGDWIKPGAVVVDCGINAMPDASKKSGFRLLGDVDYAEASQVGRCIACENVFDLSSKMVRFVYPQH